MNKDMIVRRLRPFLSKRFQCIHQPLNLARPLSTTPTLCAQSTTRDATHDFEKRLAQLDSGIARSEWYPRLPATITSSQIGKDSLETRYADLAPDQTNEEQELVFKGSIIWEYPRLKQQRADS
jgi:lysyl-tRNA synthetase class 2